MSTYVPFYDPDPWEDEPSEETPITGAVLTHMEAGIVAASAVAPPSTPAGAGMVWFSNTPPEGWAILNGATITNAQTLYPELWANVDAAWKSGANIVLPDARRRVLVGSGTGDSLAESDGLAEASRGIAHRHTVTDPTHFHSVGTYAEGGSATQPVKRATASTLSAINTGAVATGITVGPAGTPLDTPAYLILN